VLSEEMRKLTEQA
jgi:phosphoribosylanthranilate isomerase